jgi:hypothetical protein
MISLREILLRWAGFLLALAAAVTFAWIARTLPSESEKQHDSLRPKAGLPRTAAASGSKPRAADPTVH